MKKINITYWIMTILFAGFMIFSGIQNALVTSDSVGLMHDFMGYPVYIIPFLGWAKILGGIAILIPGFPRIKEWAYAGLTFDLIGAVYSTIALGTPFAQYWMMFLFIAFGAAAYIIYRKKQSLDGKGI